MKYILHLLILVCASCASCAFAEPSEAYYERISKLMADLSQNGEYVAIEELLSRELERYPEDSTIKRRLGNVYLVLGDYEKAEKYLKEGFYSNPSQATVHLALCGINSNNRELMVSTIPNLMRCRNDDAKIVFILITIGHKLEIKEKFYYGGIIAGMDPEYVMSFEPTRQQIHAQPEMFYLNKNDIERTLKEYPLGGGEAW